MCECLLGHNLWLRTGVGEGLSLFSQREVIAVESCSFWLHMSQLDSIFYPAGVGTHSSTHTLYLSFALHASYLLSSHNRSVLHNISQEKCWKSRCFRNKNTPDNNHQKEWTLNDGVRRLLNLSFDNNHFRTDRSPVTTERSVTQIMNNSKTGNWKWYRVSLTS